MAEEKQKTAILLNKYGETQIVSRKVKNRLIKLVNNSLSWTFLPNNMVIFLSQGVWHYHGLNIFKIGSFGVRINTLFQGKFRQTWILLYNLYTTNIVFERHPLGSKYILKLGFILTFRPFVMRKSLVPVKNQTFGGNDHFGFYSEI